MNRARRSIRSKTHAFLAARALAVVALLAAGAVRAGDAQAAPSAIAQPVSRLPLIDGARNPQVTVQGSKIWIVYVLETRHDAYCLTSTNAGATWSQPRRINSVPGCVSAGMERSPRIAAGKNGVLHVVWQPNWPPGGDQVWYSRSTDGLHFTPQRDIRSAPKGYDEPNITADTRGNVYAVWLDGRDPEQPGSVAASPLYLAESHDNGLTWAPASRVRSSYPGNFCGCCMPRPFLGPDGSLYIAARGAYQNVRDIWLLHRKVNQVWDAARVSNNHWVLEGCPMSGPSTALVPGGIETAWMSKSRVYWNRLSGGTDQPAPMIPLAAPPGAEADSSQNYPLVLANGQGITCVAWNEGGHVYWQEFSPALRPLGSGDLGIGIGSGPGAGRVTGYVDAAGAFRIIF